MKNRVPRDEMKEAAEEELTECSHEGKRRIECAASHLLTKLREFAKLDLF